MHGPLAFWLTTALFTITYIGLALGKVPGLRMDRAGVALVGAVLMLVFGLLPFTPKTFADALDFSTLALLFGMMVVVGMLQLSGFLQRLTEQALARIRSPVGMLAAIVVLSGALSAFLINDVVCVALTPLVLQLTRRLRYDPVPQLIGLATAANIGSSATITGNPQNIFIGSHSHIPYLRFVLRLAPPALLGLVLAFLAIWFVYRRRLAPPEPSKGIPPAPASRAAARHAPTWLQAKSALVALAAVVLFFVLPSADLPIVALAAAAVVLIDRVKPEKIYRQIDWALLVMFAGLFLVVYAFKIHVVQSWGVARWTWLLGRPVDALSVASAALSNLVSNVPAVLLFEPVVQAMPAASRETAWLALAMSSTFAGNLTLLGSVANLIVVEQARREGIRVSFIEYCKVGAPLTLATLAVGIAWLMFVPY
ncbi:MAG TPA: anion transporter [Gemmataceae bacterium]|nr:anion transporter [Gemmataceae bacterium]